jgi:C4-dicarboxylate transporter DctQ subunit
VSFFNKIEEYILIVLVPVMVIIIFIATGIRYLTTSSLPWAEELARYSMVWIGYIGASLGMKRNAHIGVSAFVGVLPKRWRPYLDFLRFVLIVLFNLLIAFFALQIIKSQVATEQVSPALRIPIWVAYGAIPVGMVLMTVRAFQAFLAARISPAAKAETPSGKDA